METTASITITHTTEAGQTVNLSLEDCAEIVNALFRRKAFCISAEDMPEPPEKGMQYETFASDDGYCWAGRETLQVELDCERLLWFSWKQPARKAKGRKATK